MNDNAIALVEAKQGAPRKLEMKREVIQISREQRERETRDGVVAPKMRV